MRTRRRFTAEYKAKVALEAIQGQRTIAELATRHELHPNLITQWKRQLVNRAAEVFGRNGGGLGRSEEELTGPLYEEIGRLKDLIG